MSVEEEGIMRWVPSVSIYSPDFPQISPFAMMPGKPKVNTIRIRNWVGASTAARCGLGG
jgi:hypothetical protein